MGKSSKKRTDRSVVCCTDYNTEGINSPYSDWLMRRASSHNHSGQNVLIFCGLETMVKWFELERLNAYHSHTVHIYIVSNHKLSLSLMKLIGFTYFSQCSQTAQAASSNLNLTTFETCIHYLFQLTIFLLSIL